MIYDRDYMQPEHDPRDAAVARPLVIAVLLGFILQAIVGQFVPGGQKFIVDHVVLSLENVTALRLWTVVTSPLIDLPLTPLSVLFVVINAVMIHYLGRLLVPQIGARGFWIVTGSAVIVGELVGLGSGLALRMPGYVVGSTGIVLALSIVFCCLNADRHLIPLPLPIPIKGKHLAWVSVAFSAFGFIFFELRREPFATPPSSLLGAMFAGWLYFRFVHQPGAVFQSSGPAIEMPAWMKRKKKVAVAASATTYTVNVSSTSPADIRAEVDRILDKINSKGFGALTVEERRILDEARDTLNKK